MRPPKFRKLALPSPATYPLYLFRHQQGADLSLHSNTPPGQYPADWDGISVFIRYLSHGRCEHCNLSHAHQGYGSLTVLHLNRLKHDCRYVNLVSLCQKCLRYVRAAYRPDQACLLDDFVPVWAKRRNITTSPSLTASQP